MIIGLANFALIPQSFVDVSFRQMNIVKIFTRSWLYSRKLLPCREIVLFHEVVVHRGFAAMDSSILASQIIQV